MSPELIAPEQFGFKRRRPTKSSDCYALGMVVYETITGELPFHNHREISISFKVIEGERPCRGVGFVDALWEMLEVCWAHHPNNRPSIEDILRCLKAASNSGENVQSKRSIV